MRWEARQDYPACPARSRAGRDRRAWRRCSWQAHRGDGFGGEAFAASGEAQALRRRRFHADAGDFELEYFGDPRAHRLAVRADLRPLADDGHVAMRDHAAFAAHETRRMIEEFPRRRAAPAFVARREMHADIAFAD